MLRILAMCISFFYINEKCTADEFRFILIFNRDEYYSRETANAHFWDDFPNILAGNDGIGYSIISSHNLSTKTSFVY